MTEKWNIKLTVGLFLLAVFVLIGLFGSFIAPYPADYKVKVGYMETDNGREFVAPPLAPSEDYLFGTDKWGKDILSLILHGAKYTVFTVLIVAAVRLLTGGIAGVLGGLAAKGKNKGKQGRITLLTSIPPVIIIYFIMLGININPSLSTFSLIMIQGVLMAALGVPGVYNVVYSKTAEIKENLYIMASVTLGGNKSHILKKHIWPILKGDFIILYLNETIQVLHLMGQLAIFNLFFGGTMFQPDFSTYISMTNEWSGLIGQSRAFLSYSQWILLYPLVAFILFLLSFYLISQGLSEQSRKRHRKNTYI